MIESHEQTALRKDPVTALLVEQLKTYFEKVYLINFISIYSNLLKYFIFVHLLVIENYEQGALEKSWSLFLSDLKHPLWESLTNKSHFCLSQLVKHFIFPYFLLIEGYGKDALCNKPAIAIFVESFKTATLTKPYWYISLPLRAICWTISFFLTISGRRLSTRVLCESSQILLLS